MTEIKRALEYAADVLWGLLVEHEKGNQPLSGDWKARIDTAEQIARDALEEPVNHGDDE